MTFLGLGVVSDCSIAIGVAGVASPTSLFDSGDSGISGSNTGQKLVARRARKGASFRSGMEAFVDGNLEICSST